MIDIKDKTLCSGCHACYNACPGQCITMQSDDEGFVYPLVNADACVKCGLCIKVCPIQNENRVLCKEEPKAFAVINANESVRLQSSSGGVFTLIAEHVIDKGGVVFGVGTDETHNPIHRVAQTKEEISSFRGSKYVQSRIGNGYSLAEQFLKEGRAVLFTGTPCQIAGLYAFLKKPYDNLITQDIICHGVPSAAVWQKYIRYREEKAGAEVSRITFRNKRLGWKRHSLLFVFKNQKEYIGEVGKDPYLRSFLLDLCLRPSCYDCRFKGKTRISDLTLADYWGIQADIPEMDDDKGTSLVIVHSDKGMQMLDAIKNDVRVVKATLDSALRHNPSMIKSAVKPQKRDAFMKEIAQSSFDKIEKKYLGVPISLRIKGFIKRGKSFVKKLLKVK